MGIYWTQLGSGPREAQGFGIWDRGLGLGALNSASTRRACGIWDLGSGIGIGCTELSQNTDGPAGFGIRGQGLGLGALNSTSTQAGVWDLGFGIGDWDCEHRIQPGKRDLGSGIWDQGGLGLLGVFWLLQRTFGTGVWLLGLGLMK